MTWFGDYNDNFSVASKLKKVYAINIFQDSGMKKGYWAKAIVHFEKLPLNLITATFKVVIGIVITSLLIYLGIKE